MTSAHPFNFDGYFDPPVQQEVTPAYKFHEAGEHKDVHRWAKQGCEPCRDIAEDLVAELRIRFTESDLRDARRWAKGKGLDYKDDTKHLLIDWLFNDTFRGTYEEVIGI